MSLSLDHYKVFYYVATYRSISRAAVILSVSQPGVSRTIASLEHELGVKLFNRSSTGVTLTEAGEIIFSHVETALRHLNAAEDEIRTTKELKKGILTIGISTALTRGVIEELLVPTFEDFHRRYPDVRLEMFHNSTQILTKDVENGFVDIAFIPHDLIESSGSGKKSEKVISLYSYSDIVIAGPEYSDLTERKVSLAELAKYPLIGLEERTDTFQFYKDFFSKYGLEYRPSFKTIGTGQILIYTMQNFGIGFIHPNDAQQALKDGQLVQIKLKEELPVRTVSILKNAREKISSDIFEKMLYDSL
ncbi:MAG: LysR family transcriptional regulator [Lachnospiraceae bacterium]|nr:LysR family transcriptional regulator [Lachnospiraceae bacterium]